MSAKQVSSVQISSGALDVSQSIGTIPCAICRRQFSRYACPRCNIPYCSLTCFRSEAHAECSESFYRKEIESDVHSASSKSAEERRSMLELLKRFEESAVDDDAPGGSSSDDESGNADADISRRLAGLDIGSASYEELWDALTPEERDRFMHALNDPSSDLAKELLSITELDSPTVEPWWTTPWPGSSSENPTDEIKTRPPIMHIPTAMVGSTPPTASLLLYNICAVCTAYAYVTRHLATSLLSSLSVGGPAHLDACRTITRLVPFLADRKSKIVHPTLSSVVTDIWSRFEPGSMSTAFFAILLNDTATLLRPAAVTVVSSEHRDNEDLENHPSANALRALSDVAALFGPPSSISRTKAVATMHKLTFYAAHILCTPTPAMRGLSLEVANRAERMEHEADLGISGIGTFDAEPLSLEETRSNVGRRTVHIEELP